MTDGIVFDTFEDLSKVPGKPGGTQDERGSASIHREACLVLKTAQSYLCCWKQKMATHFQEAVFWRP